MPRYMPRLPKQLARKKNMPSGVRFLPLPRIDLRLSRAILMNENKLMAAKIPMVICKVNIVLK